MFNVKTIQQEIIGALMRHRDHLLQALYFGGAQVQPHIQIAEIPDVASYAQAPIGEEIALLVAFANGETSDEEFPGEIDETIQSVCETLFTVPYGAYSYTIPDAFWSSALGQVIAICQVKLRGDDLITYSDAAELLFGQRNTNALMKLMRRVEQGKLTRYLDPRSDGAGDARVSTWRVSRQEVERLKK
jgi:hypothetical protein